MTARGITVVREHLAKHPAPADVAGRRKQYDRAERVFKTPEDVRVEALEGAGVPGEWLVPARARTDGAVLYLHGGGYVIGSPRSHRHVAAAIASAAGIAAMLPDYRLAPEHPYPAAVDDAVAAYVWLLRRGIAPGRIVIAGDSAGGGLTVATLIAIRQRGRPLPAAGVCISPWVDLTCSAASYTTRAEADPMVTRDGVAEMARLYLAGADAKTPLASPLHADLTGLPPRLIQVGNDEVLLDDSTQLAAQAQAAGVNAEVEVWPDMIHVWHWFLPMLDEAQRAVTRIGDFVKGHLRPA